VERKRKNAVNSGQHPKITRNGQIVAIYESDGKSENILISGLQKLF
jgi:hypothetical protein